MNTDRAQPLLPQPACDGAPDVDTMLRVIAQATRTVTEELSAVQCRVEGAIPRAIDGVLFRNGPGRFERGGVRYRHPFDGDGHLVRVEFGGGRVVFSNRFVRTREFLEEERCGRMRYRAFGTNLPGGLLANSLRLPFKNAANTSVVWHAGRLLACWEGGPPHRIDPGSLATLGPESFDGRLDHRPSGPTARLARRITPLLPFSAHPRIDAETGELVNFGLLSGRPNRLLVYRIDAAGRMADPESFDLPRFSFVHDIAVTGRWLCVLLPHASFDVARVLLGLRTPVGSLRVDPVHPMQALLIPRARGSRKEPPLILDAVPGFVFHIAQAFDADDEVLVVDAVRYPEYPIFDDFEALLRALGTRWVPRLERWLIRPQTGSVSVSPLSQRPFELPVTAPGPLGAPRRHLYGVGAPEGRGVPYFTAIQRLDTDTGSLQALDFGSDPVGEPVLVPDPEGGEGWLLSLVHRAGGNGDAGRTELQVLNAADLTVVARAMLPLVVPLGFHGSWVRRVSVGDPRAGGGQAASVGQPV
jgi:all-trans-8'-apo-beta-carotenal 15,15'-oxygenase